MILILFMKILANVVKLGVTVYEVLNDLKFGFHKDSKKMEEEERSVRIVKEWKKCKRVKGGEEV